MGRVGVRKETGSKALVNGCTCASTSGTLQFVYCTATLFYVLGVCRPGLQAPHLAQQDEMFTTLSVQAMPCMPCNHVEAVHKR